MSFPSSSSLPSIEGRQLQSLDGGAWQFCDAAEPHWQAAEVPGSVHRDLLRLGLIPDPFWGANEKKVQWIETRDWIYRTDFTVADSLRGAGHLDLVAEGLDTVARILLNGRVIGRSENMFVRHRWDVTRRLLPGTNSLEIHFESPMSYIRRRRPAHAPREINDPVGGCTRIRKQQCSFGWDWGPRLATVGIWQPIALEGWSINRIESVRVDQRHSPGHVTLTVQPEMARASRGLTFESVLSLDENVIASSRSGTLEVSAPALWWPRGQGEQTLHTLVVECRKAGRLVDRWQRRIGLRTIVLDRSRDAAGESFRFVVNGRPVFAKGANWIPAHALTGGLGTDSCRAPLEAAAAAHMNMIRVWGGGIYEPDAFYDRCDELGLMVWQDFMFACTLYPGDAAFLGSVRTEARQQIERLRHHACLALWCGNNEIELLNGETLRTSPRIRGEYRQLFETTLRKLTAVHGGGTDYWRSSSCGSQTAGKSKDGARLTGDWHDWDVWHARQPVKAYEQSRARFVSEFGMQSFSSPAVAATYCPPAEWNILSPVMESHQKNPAGNSIILDYVSRLYRFPKDYAALAYLSQLNQAHCMKVAVEHWRRSQPRTMGALYWQLNDCWPGPSWSSLEFGGRWKVLHHVARRFFAPLLVSARLAGDDVIGIGNRVTSTVRVAEIFTVSDHFEPVSARLDWEVWHLHERRVLSRGHRAVVLPPRRAQLHAKLDLGEELTQYGHAGILLRVKLEAKGWDPQEDVVLFTAPRYLNLERAPIEVQVAIGGGGRRRVRFASPVYQHCVMFDVPGVNFSTSDNAFDLLPGVPREVVVEAPGIRRAATLRKKIVTQSLVDSY
ncbi:MAG: csxA 1 [Verrucomicrobia bacterium]|nr:csxA 1 [Verrucomicrobiota bacterium]